MSGQEAVGRAQGLPWGPELPLKVRGGAHPSPNKGEGALPEPLKGLFQGCLQPLGLTLTTYPPSLQEGSRNKVVDGEPVAAGQTTR